MIQTEMTAIPQNTTKVLPSKNIPQKLNNIPTGMLLNIPLF